MSIEKFLRRRKFLPRKKFLRREKFLRRNLGLPLERRLSASRVQFLESMAQIRGDVAALRVTIHREIIPKLTEQRRIDGLIDRIGSRSGGFENLQMENQDFVFDLKKYVPETYGVGRQTEPADLGEENSPEWACIKESEKIAEQQKEI